MTFILNRIPPIDYSLYIYISIGDNRSTFSSSFSLSLLSLRFDNIRILELNVYDEFFFFFFVK